jgi:hypothetical protein
VIVITWKALNKTKEVIVKYLKLYLKNPNNYRHLVPEELDPKRYADTDIYVTEPQQLRSFPVVIITGTSGDMITAGLGDMALEVHNPYTDDLVAYKYGGIYEFNLTIEIGTRSTLDREIFTDLVTQALRYAVRRKMEAEGVLVKSMRYGGETSVKYDSNNIYVSQINLSTWSEWYENAELLPAESFDIDIHLDDKKD